MRPLRLHLDNFGSFREPVTVDFTDADYFALVGPTGAGKSTVIDAICFALYGTVPRWNDEKVIAPALAPSAVSGKVALVFEAGGRRYAVVRALRRDAKGRVQTQEARLDELDPAVPLTASLEEMTRARPRSLAEGDEVTDEIQRVTGLPYKFFTQCVVLPQGRFAEFLHAPPRARQDLLVQLLDAGVYEEVRQRAVREETAARQAAEFARGELARITAAGEDDERAAAERLDALRALRDRLEEDLRRLTAQEEALRGLAEERRATAAKVAALEALAMPPDVPNLADKQRRITEAVAELTAEVARLAEEEQRADEELAALGDREVPARALAALEERGRVRSDLALAEAKAEEARAALEPLGREAAEAKAALADIERRRDRLRDAHTAAALAQRLAVGEPCPTCLRPVTELPHHPALTDLRTAERAVAARRTKAEEAATRYARAEANARNLARQVTALRERLAELDARAVMSREEAETRMSAIREAERRATRARAVLREARKRLAEAEKRAAELANAAELSWRDLEAARDTVVALDAPPLDRSDLGRAWTRLLAWRGQVVVRERDALAAQERQIEDGRRLLEREREVLLRRLEQHGVTVPGNATPTRIGESVVAAVTRAENHLERIRENRRRAAELEDVATAKEREARVAHDLALLLKANQFEGWLCEEALELLVAAASDTLRELSDGQYELALGPRRELEVIDYAEAGMRRSARTLSGGETFQAALALALALSGQVAGLAATAARSLDSIFLDEGFGTLDPATLDTVATTLERLATADDRMVGVVTHVPALAERVPVRFEISRDAKGSHIRRATP